MVANEDAKSSEYKDRLPPIGAKMSKPPTHNRTQAYSKPIPLVYQAGWAGIRARSRSIQRRTDQSVERSAERGRSSSVVRAAKAAGSVIKSAFSNVRGRSSSRARFPSDNVSSETNLSVRGRSASRRGDLDQNQVETSDTERQTESVERPVKINKINELASHSLVKLDRKTTVLHVACIIHHESEDIIQRLEEEPNLAFESNSSNELPLHFAAMDKKGVDHEVLKRLLKTNPKGVKQPNIQNSLPIHLACMVGVPSMTVLKTFLKLYPKSVMFQSDFPLLFDRDMMVSTENNYNQFFSDDDDEVPAVETGFSPLHLAILNQANPAAVKVIVETDPQCIHLKTTMGRTALHCAQYIIKKQWMYGENDEASVENTFKSIEIIEESIKDDGDIML